jgi:hypothetical protein
MFNFIPEFKNSFYKKETRRIGAPVVQAYNYINQYLWVMQQTKYSWRVGGDPPKQHFFQTFIFKSLEI